jgi:hypothetical protein
LHIRSTHIAPHALCEACSGFPKTVELEQHRFVALIIGSTKLEKNFSSVLLVFFTLFTINAFANDVSNAQDQANIAQSNAIAQTAMAEAQATLLKAQLDNQKAQLDSIQSALQGIDASKYKTTVSNALSVKATTTRLLSEKLVASLTAKGSPVEKIAELKKPLVIERASLGQDISVYKSVEAQLRVLTSDLTTKMDNLQSQRVSTSRLLPALAAITSLGNLVTSYIATAKPQYAFNSTSIEKENADNLLQAAFYSSLIDQEVELIDPDEAIYFCYPIFIGDAEPCAGSGKLVELAEKTAKKISDAKNLLKATKRPDTPKNTKQPDPYAQVRENYDALVSATDSVDKIFKSLFVADTNGTIPFLRAEKGEYIGSLLSEGAYLVSAKTITMDADTVVRDGTFSRYKLSVAGTTTFSFRVTDGKGVVKVAKFIVLSNGWEKQKLENE